jgi:serine/threonine protein kinase
LVFSCESKAPDREAFIAYMFRDLSLPDEEDADSPIYHFYELCSVLGSGNFSTVKLAVDKRTGNKVAVKIIDKRKHWHNYKTRESIEREVTILQQIKHDNIIAIHEIYDTPKFLYIVLELYVHATTNASLVVLTVSFGCCRATGGDLFESIMVRGSYTENDARRVIVQILQALHYLHERNIAHRDLKVSKHPSSHCVHHINSSN